MTNKELMQENAQLREMLESANGKYAEVARELLEARALASTLEQRHKEDEQKLRNTLQGLLQLNTQRDEAHLALVKLINHGAVPVGAPQTGK